MNHTIITRSRSCIEFGKVTRHEKPAGHSAEVKAGDWVKIQAVPADLTDAAGMATPQVFQRALGKTFQVQGIGPAGHLELEVSKRDTIWIEPELARRVAAPKAKRT